MPPRTVKPEQVKSLRDWVARWPKVSNLSFDPETREATIYTADAARTRVGSIAWVREADTLTILTQPQRFSTQAVQAAQSRLGKIKEQDRAMTASMEDQLRVAEAAVLEASRIYEAADAGSRAVLRRDVLSAERQYRELETSFADQTQRGRAIRTLNGYSAVYVPPMPLNRRGIPVAAATEAGTA
jgi:hypothetical protein